MVAHRPFPGDPRGGGGRHAVPSPEHRAGVRRGAHRTDPAEREAALRRLAASYLERLGPGRVTDTAWAGEMAVRLDNVRQVVGDLGDPEAAQALAASIGLYHDLVDAFGTGIEEMSLVPGGSRPPARIGSRS